MVITSLENAESPFLVALERGLFGPFFDSEVVLGLKEHPNRLLGTLLSLPDIIRSLS
jgi:hypothetical protein